MVATFKLESSKDILGFNLSLKNYNKTNDQKRVLLVAHGWPGPKNPQEWCDKEFPENEYCFSLCPQLSRPNNIESILCKGSFFKLLEMKKNIDLMQDAEILFYALNQNFASGYKTDLIGYSRGGAAIVTLLDILFYPNMHKPTLKKFKLAEVVISEDKVEIIPDYKTIEQIRESIGKVILEKPLMSLKDTIKKLSFKEILNKITKKYDSTCFRFLKRKILMSIKELSNKKNSQPIDILEKLATSGKGKDIDIHITLAAHDNIISNKKDTQLKILAKKAGWTIIKVLEKHDEIKTTKQLYKSYLAKNKFYIPDKIRKIAHEKVEEYANNCMYYHDEKSAILLLEKEIFIPLKKTFPLLFNKYEKLLKIISYFKKLSEPERKKTLEPIINFFSTQTIKEVLKQTQKKQQNIEVRELCVNINNFNQVNS